mgnify:CR=1 FL=1
MSPETLLLVGTAVPTLCYAVVACTLAYTGQLWYALVWFGYAAANIGLMKSSGII